MTTVLSFLFVLGVLVFVHELGHFLAAKRVGIKVLKFQLGFNPTIFSIKRGDTEYSIGALPLGGYVKMAGENPEDNPTGNQEEFLSRSKWERFQVLFAGPLMNLALALLLTVVVTYQGERVPVYLDQPVVVGSVDPETPAASSDLKPGDRIVAIADRAVATWDEFYLQASQRPDRDTAFRVERDGQPRTVTFKIAKRKGAAFVAECHAAGITVNVWTVNDEPVATALAAAGVDALITDTPAILRTWL